MGRQRLKERDRDAFFGDFVYKQVAPKGHSLGKLNEVVPWPRFTYKLVKRDLGAKGKILFVPPREPSTPSAPRFLPKTPTQ